MSEQVRRLQGSVYFNRALIWGAFATIERYHEDLPMTACALVLCAYYLFRWAYCK